MTIPAPTSNIFGDLTGINQALVDQARKLATAAHAELNQRYDGAPYSVHLAAVAAICGQWLELLPAAEHNLALCGAWVHDLLEDVSAISYNDLAKALHPAVAEVGFLLATPKGRNRAERHCDAYYQEMATSRVATFVKLADRLANVRHSARGNNRRMLAVYQQEAPHFARFLRPAWPVLAPMWGALDELLQTQTVPVG